MIRRHFRGLANIGKSICLICSEEVDRKMEFVLTTPVFARYSAPLAPVFLSVLMRPDNRESVSVATIFQVVFFMTFLGNYPWTEHADTFALVPSNDIGSYFNLVLDHLGLIMHFDFTVLSQYAMEHKSFLLLLIVGLKIITELTSRIGFPTLSKDRTIMTITIGMFIGACCSYGLIAGLISISTHDFLPVPAARICILSFVPIAIGLAGKSLWARIRTYSGKKNIISMGES